MNYNELEELITPYFLSRGGGMLSDSVSKRNYICIALTDIFNYARWNDTYVEEDIVGVLNGTEYNYETMYQIGSVFEIAQIDTYGNLSKIVASVGAHRGDIVNIGEKVITSDTSITKIRIGYYKAYEWYQVHEGTTPLPLPNKFIPALINMIYDYASPINAFEGEGQISKGSIAMKQLAQIKEADGITTTVQIVPPTTNY